jgi:tetratricopeptide (TPR) repeat protein
MSDKFDKEKPAANSNPADPNKPVLGRYEDFEDTADETTDDEYFGVKPPAAPARPSLEWEDDDLDDEEDHYGAAGLIDTDDEDDFEGDEDELVDEDEFEDEDENEDEDDLEVAGVLEGDEFEDEDDEDGLEDDDEFEDEDDEEYEAGEYEEDDEDAAQNQFSQEQLFSQLTSNPLFAQVQQMLNNQLSGPDRTMTQARMLQATGNLEGAAQLYLDVIQEVPDHVKAYIQLGQVLMAMDKPAEAEPFLQKATELDPEDAAAFLYLGYSHYGQEQFETAIDDFKKAAALDKGNPLALNNLGFVQYLTGKLDEAADTFTRAGDFGSDRAYYNLGLVRLIQGKESEGWSAYLEAFDLDPNGRQIEDHLKDVQKAMLKYPDKAPLLDDAVTRLYSRYGDAGDDFEDGEDTDEEV